MTNDPPLRDRLMRTISLRSGPGEIAAEVQDNVHHFRVALTHDGARVTEIAAEAPRHPWTSCPQGIARLRALIGAPLESGTPAGIDKAQQCTHMFDLAKLAMKHALRGGERSYAAAITRLSDNLYRAELQRDGAALLDWTVTGDQITAPAAFAGHATSGPAIWPAAISADPDLAEAAIVLRRALLVGRGWRRSGHMVHAEELQHMVGTCLTFQPEQLKTAERPQGFVELAS